MEPYRGQVTVLKNKVAKLVLNVGAFSPVEFEPVEGAGSFLQTLKSEGWK